MLNLYKAGDGFVADSILAAEQVQHVINTPPAATGRRGEDRVAVGGASPLGNLRAYAAAIELAIERRNRSQVYLRSSRCSMCTSMLGSTRSLRDRVERVPAATVPCFGPAGPRPLELLRQLGAELRAAGRPSEAKKWEKETHKRDKRMHAYRFFFGDAATRLGHEMPLRLGRLSVGGAS